MHVGAGGVEAKSELRKLFALHAALCDLAFLSSEMDVAIPLSSVEGVLPLRVAGRIFDQMCDELGEAVEDGAEAGGGEASAAAVASHVKRAMGRALRYCSRHALATDDVIGAYINEALSRVGFARSVALHRRVIAALYCIEAKQTRFAAALLVLRAARAPFGAEIDALLERCDGWATSTSQIETLREQQQVRLFFHFFCLFQFFISHIFVQFFYSHTLPSSWTSTASSRATRSTRSSTTSPTPRPPASSFRTF
jgi:hypothetical protein